MKNKMIKSVLFLVLAGFPCLVNAQSPSWLWAIDSEGASNESCLQLVTSVDGSTYLQGSFSDSFSVGELQGDYNGTFLDDNFLAKFSPAGEPEWMLTLGQPGFAFIFSNSLETDSEGNIYIACNLLRDFETQGEITFTLGGESIILPDSVDNVSFIAKLDPEGNTVWINTLDGAQLSNLRLAVDNDDRLYVAGAFFGNVQINNTTVNNLGAGDLLLCSLDTDGNIDWVMGLGSPEDEQSVVIEPCEGGGVLMSSTWSGDSIFVGNLHVVNPDAINGGTIFEENNRDRWVAKVNPDATAQWLVREGGLLSEEAGKLESTPTGGAMVLSSLLPPIDIGGQFFDTPGWLLTRYSPTGELENTVHIPTQAPGSSSILGIENDRYILALNTSDPTFTYGDFAFSNSGGANGTTDAYIAAIDQDGAPQWMIQVGAEDGEVINVLSAAPSGEIMAGGAYSSMELDLGDFTLENSGTFTRDFFLGSLNIALSILENPGVTEFKVFPNPAISQVALDLSEIGTRPVTIRIVDARGAIAAERSISTGGIVNMDVGNLSPGVYAIVFVMDGKLHASKLIKR